MKKLYYWAFLHHKSIIGRLIWKYFWWKKSRRVDKTDLVGRPDFISAPNPLKELPSAPRMAGDEYLSMPLEYEGEIAGYAMARLKYEDKQKFMILYRQKLAMEKIEKRINEIREECGLPKKDFPPIPDPELKIEYYETTVQW